MRYLIFPDDPGAENRSEELWQEYSGTGNNDGTRFLYLAYRSEAQEGGSIMIVHDQGELLSNEERSQLGEVGDERYEEWIRQHLESDADDE